jgi:hypothetical protein
LYSSPNTVKGIISRKLTWDRLVECIQETRNAYGTVVRKPEETTCRCEDNIKMNPRGVKMSTE